MQVLCQRLGLEQAIKTKSLIWQSSEWKIQTDRQTIITQHNTVGWVLGCSFSSRTEDFGAAIYFLLVFSYPWQLKTWNFLKHCPLYSGKRSVLGGNQCSFTTKKDFKDKTYHRIRFWELLRDGIHLLTELPLQPLNRAHCFASKQDLPHPEAGSNSHNRERWFAVKKPQPWLSSLGFPLLTSCRPRSFNIIIGWWLTTSSSGPDFPQQHLYIQLPTWHLHLGGLTGNLALTHPKWSLQLVPQTHTPSPSPIQKMLFIQPKYQKSPVTPHLPSSPTSNLPVSPLCSSPQSISDLLSPPYHPTNIIFTCSHHL